MTQRTQKIRRYQMKTTGKLFQRKMMVTVLLAMLLFTVLSAGVVSAKSLPKDKGRVVLQGRVRKLSHKGLLKLQKLKKSPNPSDYKTYKNKKFYVIVLDKPRKISLYSDADSCFYKWKVRLIDVSGIKGIKKYAGKHCIFSINKMLTYIPSDTSLPLGEPRTRNLHIYRKSSRSWVELKS